MSTENFRISQHFSFLWKHAVAISQLWCYYNTKEVSKMAAKVVESCANRLRKALALRNMKQADLAEITKIPKSAISHYLSGSFEPKHDRVFVIAKALDVDPVWLMGFDVPMEDKVEAQKEISPGEPSLTEGEKQLLQLFREIPVDRQPEALELLAVALKMQKKRQ
jgi:transcriptional regulator with XRE-family HTH domain